MVRGLGFKGLGLRGCGVKIEGFRGFSGVWGLRFRDLGAWGF